MNYNEKEIESIAKCFKVSLKRLRPDLVISGSPERSDFRCVFEDLEGKLFLMEGFENSRFHTKTKIAETIKILNNNGLSRTIPYIESQEDAFIVRKNDLCWQVSRFLKSDPLERPTYVNIPEIGSGLASFLSDLKRISNDSFGSGKDFSFFSIKQYIISILSQIEKFNPEIIQRIKPVYSFLSEDFFTYHDSLKRGFCHGDIHIMNVIWNRHEIKAVIDWEFMGMKPEIYDLANLLGCIGIEEPEALGGNLVKALISELKKNKVYEPESWRVLPEFLIAIRFGWLSEWLRKKDHEMIDLETDFMNLIVKYCNDIKSNWDAIKGDD